MIGMMLSGVVAIGLVCALAYRLALYALPAMLGFAAARLAYDTGSGLIGAGIVALVSGGIAFGVLSVAFVSLRSPVSWALVGTVFAVPAAGAGYMLIHGITRDATISEFWRQVFCVSGGALIGFSALMRLSVPANHPKG